MSRHFSVNTDVATVSPSASINNLAAWTFAAWVKPTADSPFGGASVAVKQDQATDNCYIQPLGTKGTGGVYALSSYIVLGGNTNTAAQSNSVETVAINQWSHITASWAGVGSPVRLYRNGVECTYVDLQNVTPAPEDDSPFALYVGTDNGDEDNFIGDIAEFVIYNVVLTPTQIASLYNGGNPVPGNLVESLMFLTNQGSPEPDASGHSNSAVIAGASFSSDNPGGVNPMTVPFLGSVSETADDSQGTQYIGHVQVVGSVPAGASNPYLGKIKKVLTAPAGNSDPILGQVVIVAGPPVGYTATDAYLGHVEES